MAVDKSLVSGSTTMLVLKLLEEKDMYGYEMIDTLRGKSKNVFELKAGTLYPLLHGLEEKGFVEAYEKEAVGKILPHYKSRQKGIKEKIRRMERIFTGSSGCDGRCVLWIGEDIYRQ